MRMRELIENDMASFFKNLQKTDPKFKNLRVHGDPEHDELRRQDDEKREAERASVRQQAHDATAQDHANLEQLEAEYAEMLEKYKSLGGNSWQYADREQNLSRNEREARSMEHGLHHLHARIARAKKHGISESASAGATSSASIATVVNPDYAHNANKKPVKSVNALDQDEVSLFGAPMENIKNASGKKAAIIKRR
jgi:hypothetical protein